MPNTPLNPDALEDAADVIWMRANGEHGVCRADRERGSYRIAVDAAEEAISAYLAVAQPVVTATIENFINQRPEYITALKGTSGTDDQGDYWRWSGGAEARRQLATMLGWTVPHEPGETTRPEVK